MEIYGINGPVVKVKGSREFRMLEMVRVGNQQLIGEVIGIDGDMTVIQVYETTDGLKIGEPVVSTKQPFSLQLGPGIIGNIFDGIERPLQYIEKKSGSFIARGIALEPLDPQKKWKTKILVQSGTKVRGGDILAEIPETPIIKHKIMVPPNLEGEITECVSDGEYTIHDTLFKLKPEQGSEIPLTMVQSWPIRTARPCTVRKPISKLFVTGQRIIDTLFPIAKGGAAAVPGGFGTGKTMTQHQLAKWSDADIIVYIGCGERGNEMTQVLEEFGELTDPKSGRPLMDRTVLIANTSNMPVAAREASIYTGITLAEYYRDMGYDVAIMADSTSRWAEALREISGRLEEMPAEEGFPAYLPSRLAGFYERSGQVENLNGTEGSITIIGAVSPQGGDFSEPVTQNTKRFIRAFLALDRQLAYARHYPAINWLQSYSEYVDDLTKWYEDNVNDDFLPQRAKLIKLLQEESNLMEIVKLVGSDVLPDEHKLILEVARVIRIGFLQQNAYHASDTFVPLHKQYLMMKVITKLYDASNRLITEGVPMSALIRDSIFDDVSKMKYEVDNDHLEKLMEYEQRIDAFYTKFKQEYQS